MKRAGRTSHCTLVAALLLTTAGCVTKHAAKFTYTPSELVSADAVAPLLPLRVAVRPFQDFRGFEVVDHRLLGLIPLVPYSTRSYERPERAGTQPGFMFNPARDFPRALVDELRQNGFFREVVYDLGADERDVDLIVSGKVTSTRFVRKRMTYGLSVFAADRLGLFLALAGLPTDIYECAVSFTVEVRRASDDIVVWSHEVEGSRLNFVGAYYGSGRYDDFAGLLRQGLHAAMASLANEIRTRDLSYWKGGP
jgi:hypothetical protein